MLLTPENDISFQFRKTATPVSAPTSHATDAMADAVCDMMGNNGSISMREMSKRLDIGIVKPNGILNALRADGTVERTSGQSDGGGSSKK